MACIREAFTMYKKPAFLFFAVVFMILGVTACTTRPVQPFAVIVREMGTCEGWNVEESQPINVNDVFRTKDRRIYMYAYLETNEKLFFQTVWLFEGRPVWSQIGQHETGYIYSYVEPKDGKAFPVGDYEIHLVLGRTVLRKMEFKVVESEPTDP